jgi:Ser/Thr protein kinase RdoA (MazF antagonist)
MSACAVAADDDDATMRSGLPPVSEERARAEVLKHYALAAASARELPCERDQMFHLTTRGGEEFLLKIYHPAERLTAIEMESAVLAHLAHADAAIPVPRLVKSGEGRSHATFSVGESRRVAKVLTYLPGVPVAHVRRSQRLRWNMGSMLARLDLALASFVPSVPERALMWDIRRAPELRHLLPNLKGDAIGDLVASALDDFQDCVEPRLAALPQQTIHNDFNMFNVLVDERDPETPTGIIDFGDVIYGPRVFEVAVAANFQAAESEAPLVAAKDLICAYEDVNGLTAPEHSLLLPLIRTRLAMTVLISEWRAALHPENVTYIMKNNPAARLGLQRLAAVSVDAFADALHSPPKAH